MEIHQLITYSFPKELRRNADYTVRVRRPEGEWEELDTLLVKVDMHQVREASMSRFDFAGAVEVEVTCHRESIEQVEIRPLSSGLIPVVEGERIIRFSLNRPQKLSIEINGDRFHNLHLFAKALEVDTPDPADRGVAVIEPGIHRTEILFAKLKDQVHTLYFKPGMHHIEQVLLSIPSNISVYLAGGSVLVGSIVCDRVEHVKISGRGLIYLSDFGRFSAFRGVRIQYSSHIEISGIAVIDPPH
jgi:hypothetical protein